MICSAGEWVVCNVWWRVICDIVGEHELLYLVMNDLYVWVVWVICRAG